MTTAHRIQNCIDGFCSKPINIKLMCKYGSKPNLILISYRDTQSFNAKARHWSQLKSLDE